MLTHQFQGSYTSDPTEGKFVDIFLSTMVSFEKANDDELQAPFNVLANSTADTVVIVLPYHSFADGTGKGYVLDLLEAMRDTFPTEFLHDIKHELMGSAVVGRSLFIVKSRYPVTMNHGKQRRVYPNEVLPDVVLHLRKAVKKSVVSVPSFMSSAHDNSSRVALPPPELWGNKYLIVQKEVGKTVSVDRLTATDIEALFGYTPASPLCKELLPVVPLVVLENWSAGL